MAFRPKGRKGSVRMASYAGHAVGVNHEKIGQARKASRESLGTGMTHRTLTATAVRVARHPTGSGHFRKVAVNKEFRWLIRLLRTCPLRLPHG